jgi:hypothetical protein
VTSHYSDEAQSAIPLDLNELRRTRICPNCQARLEEDTWGERNPVTGLLYAEPRLVCPKCGWLQPR